MSWNYFWRQIYNSEQLLFHVLFTKWFYEFPIQNLKKLEINIWICRHPLIGFSNLINVWQTFNLGTDDLEPDIFRMLFYLWTGVFIYRTGVISSCFNISCRARVFWPTKVPKAYNIILWFLMEKYSMDVKITPDFCS